MEKMFEVAVRNKYRFNFRGLISSEDLWDLSVKDLDSIFKELNHKLKEAKEESLLNTKSKEDKELDVKIEIVKYIVKTKLEEEELRNKAKQDKEKKQRILEIISNKQETELTNKSIEELTAMLNDLK
jgi:hypothetical protein